MSKFCGLLKVLIAMGKTNQGKEEYVWSCDWNHGEGDFIAGGRG